MVQPETLSQLLDRLEADEGNTEAVPQTVSGHSGLRDLQRLLRYSHVVRKAGSAARTKALADLAESIRPADAREALPLAKIAFAAKRFERSRSLLDEFAAGSQEHDWMALDAALEREGGDIDKALEKTDNYASQWAVVVLGAPLGERPNLCILKEKPLLVGNPLNLQGLRIGGNTIGQIFNAYPKRYRYFSFYPQARTARTMQRSGWMPDVVLNSVVNGETLGDPDLRGALNEAIDLWGLPCINRPDAAYATARDKLRDTLGASPDLTLPDVGFYKPGPEETLKAIADKLEERFGYPLIIRMPFMQEGLETELCRDRGELLAHLPRMRDAFFAIQFIENHHRPGLYRKIRAAFVGDRLLVLRLDYNTHWNVRGRRYEAARVAFYKENLHLLDEENEMCGDPKAYLGERAMRGLQYIRDRIELDFFGIDFDVGPDGRPIIFEANSSMNLFTNPFAMRAQPKARDVDAALHAAVLDLIDKRAEAGPWGQRSA